MFVGKPRINYIFLKKKGKKRLTLCSVKLTCLRILFVFYLAQNGSAAKKSDSDFSFVVSFGTFSCNT